MEFPKANLNQQPNSTMNVSKQFSPNEDREAREKIGQGNIVIHRRAILAIAARPKGKLIV